MADSHDSHDSRQAVQQCQCPACKAHASPPSLYAWPRHLAQASTPLQSSANTGLVRINSSNPPCQAAEHLPPGQTPSRCPTCDPPQAPAAGPATSASSAALSLLVGLMFLDNSRPLHRQLLSSIRRLHPACQGTGMGGCSWQGQGRGGGCAIRKVGTGSLKRQAVAQISISRQSYWQQLATRHAERTGAEQAHTAAPFTHPRHLCGWVP